MTGLDLDGDLDRVFLAEFAVDVVAGGVTVQGIKDDEEVVEDTGQGLKALPEHISVVIRTGALTLERGDTITVDGVSMKVVDQRREGRDGKLNRVVVKTA